MSTNTTAPASVNQAMTAEQAGNAIESMLSDEFGDQQEQEAQQDDESEAVEVSDSVEDDATDDEAEDEESFEDVEDEQEDEAPRFTVKVDGKDVEVSLDELQKGYSRTEDYTRKTQALANERKTAQAEFEQVRNERAQYAQLLTALQAQLEQAQPQVDMDRLYQEDPIEWVRQRELQRENSEKMMAVQSEQQRLAQVHAQEQSKYMQETLQRQKEMLLSQAPELKDPKLAAQAKKSWIESGKAIGLTEDELNGLTDHRFILALRKMAAYDAIVAKRKAVQPERKAAPVSKPGNASIGRKQQSSVVKQSQQRFAKTGHVKDAASLIEKLL